MKAEEAVRRHAHRLIELDEELRKRIALELHDDIGQELTALILNISSAAKSLDAASGLPLLTSLEDSKNLAVRINRTVRTMMAELRPPQLDDYGLVATVRWHASQHALRSGISISVYAEEEFPRLPPGREVVIFRIVQEALTNVAKHASATKADILFQTAGTTARISIVDDGAGFLPQGGVGEPASGWGLTIMRERAELIGGQLQIESVPGEGTALIIEVGVEE